MKQIFLFCAVVLLVCPAAAPAMTIDVLSGSSYSITAEADASGSDYQVHETDYSVTASTPVSFTGVAGDPPSAAQVSVSAGYLQASDSAQALGVADAFTYSSSDTIFRPTAAGTIMFSANVNPEEAEPTDYHGVSATLTDLTTGVTIWTFFIGGTGGSSYSIADWPIAYMDTSWQNPGTSKPQPYVFSPTHTYELDLVARDDGGTDEGDGGSGSLSTNATVGAPEPGTILLIGFGLAGLAAYRRKFRTN